MKSTIWMLASCLVAAAAQSAPLDPPPQGPAELPWETFGDEDNVSLLAGLLNDEDSLVREQAVRALGETHNDLAIPAVRRAAEDADAGVRCEAVQAAAQFAEKHYRPVLLKALGDADDRVVLAALRCVRRTKLIAAGEPIGKLLPRPDPFLQASALRAMNELGIAADAGALKGLLNSRSSAVRLRAAENAMLLEGAGVILADLSRLAEADSSPAVRGAALAAVGKFAFAASADLISRAQGDADPLVRRGALRACALGGQAARIRAFLDDDSPMVRLAAIRAAGELRCADCLEWLFELLQEVPDAESHLAARDSIRRIAAPEVAQAAGAIVERLAKDTDSERSVRNIRAACWLLGELKSSAALDTQLRLLATLEIDSPILVALAEALGKIGDVRAAAPLQDVLARCRDNGRGALVARQASPPRRPPPYDERVAGALIEALAELKATEAVDTIIATATVEVRVGRLNRPAAVAMRALPRLVTPANRAAIERCICGILADPQYDLILGQAGGFSTARIDAAGTAGALKVEAALPALRAILADQRPCRPIMLAAAWAIQEITGQTPAVPDPKVRQGDWIIRKLSP